MLKQSEEKLEELERVNLEVILEQRRNRPKAPWKNARRLNSEQAHTKISIQQVYEIAKRINDPRNRCLFIMVYICGCRIGEIVRKDRIKYGKKEVYLKKKNKLGNYSWSKSLIQDHKKRKILRSFESIKKKDILVENYKGKKVLIITLRNLKNKNPQEQIKQIPLPLDEPINRAFYKMIRQYVLPLHREEELFPISERRAEQIISALGFNAHFLRKLRLTHMVKYHNFSDQKLKKFSGWSDSRPAKAYIGVTWEDLVDSM